MQKVPFAVPTGVEASALVERFTVTGVDPVFVTWTGCLAVSPGSWTTLICPGLMSSPPPNEFESWSLLEPLSKPLRIDFASFMAARTFKSHGTEQGAGILNVLAAVKEAKSIRSGFDNGSNNDHDSNSFGGGLLINPGQINVVQDPGDTAKQPVQVTNTGSTPVTVNLSTRALASTPVGTANGTFCMQPGTVGSCPANTGVFPIWSGVSEVYQEENFTVPSTSSPS